MKLRNLLFLLILLVTKVLVAQVPAILFSENKNQWPEQVLYRTSLYQGYLYAEKNCLTYYFTDPKTSKHNHAGQGGEIDEERILKKLKEFAATGKQTHAASFDSAEHDVHSPDSIKSHAYKVYFNNMNSKVKIYGVDAIAGTENYFIGNNQKKWATDVKSYKTLFYENIYNHIDLQMYDNFGALKYDFIVRKGGNPQKIALQYAGVSSMEINTDGTLIIHTSINQVYEQKPYAYQIINNDTITIPCEYKLNFFQITYELGTYNKDYDLYIDPELIFSTYTGSSADNWGFTATYDNENNVYAGGIVNNIGYPVSQGAIQTVYNGGAWDIGIIKYDPTGASRLYATYLGGLSSEMPHSLIVNSKNELLILGTTGSSNFPTAQAYDATFNGGKNITYDNAITFENGVDMFVAKLHANGNQLISSTFIGGTANDGINFDWETNLDYGHDSLYYNYGDGARGEIMVDDADNVYIASTTFSNNFPTVNGFQSTFGGMQDAVICKFNPSLSNLVWSTYAGGTSKDAAYSIDVDNNGNTYVTGGTCSPTMNLLPTGFNPNRIGGVVDAFVIKVDQSNGSLVASTYYGSDKYDQAYFVKVNDEGKVFIYGQTTASGSTLIYNANYATPNSGQFLASFSNDLSNLHWSTVFGSGMGRPNISPTAFEVDICNRIYLAGVGRDQPDEDLGEWYYDTNLGYYRYDYFGWRYLQGTNNMEVTSNAKQKETDGKDFYILVIDDEANSLEYATFFGEQNYGGYYSYDLIYQNYIPCFYSGHDHVDGGTSRFDKRGFIYQSACASCGGCQKFPTEPKPTVWSTTNNSTNCNNAVFRFFIDFGLLITDFELPEINCETKELEFTNTTQTYYNNPNVTYTWIFGDGNISHDLNPKHTYTAPGEYTVTLIAQDSTACNLLDSISKKLTIVETIFIDTLAIASICSGDTLQIGIPQPYDSLLVYKWDPNYNIENDTIPLTRAYPDSTTTYTLTVSQGWCVTKYVQQVIVYSNTYAITNLDVTVNGKPKNPICKGEKAKITVTTSEPSLQYIWSTSRNFSTYTTTTGLQNYIEITPDSTTTVYVISLSKFCDFKAIDSVTIHVSFNQIVATGDTLICKGDMVNILVQNLTPANSLSYSWIPKFAIVTDDLDQNPLVNPERSTNFIVYATSDAGCIYTDTVTVQVNDLQIDTVLLNLISCFGQTDASIEISPRGIPPYQIEWENNETIELRQNLPKGTYIASVTDALGCQATSTFIIIEPAKLEIIDTSYFHATCNDACNGIISVNAAGGTLPYSYKWSNFDTTAQITNLCKGSYNLEITDAHGCKTALSQSITIAVFEKLPQLQAYADDSTLFKTQSTLLHAIKIPNDSVEYIWMPNIWIENYNKAVATITPQESITYYVRATDKYGCSSLDTVEITVSDWQCADPFIYVPTAFTPNKDGKNDFIQVESGVITSLTFAIYDRWGEKVFETNSLNQSWDGTYLGKKIQPQVLVYYLEATCINQEKIVQKGNITLIR